MIVEETFYRRPETGRESRRLASDIYNLALRLLHRCGSDALFVPIRNMQYLAVVDREEFIFVDRHGGRFIELSWRGFRPAARATLDAPVAFEAVYYTPEAAGTITRLHAEFRHALETLEQRMPTSSAGRARVLPFGRA
jgi:hypothetical protein